MRCLGQDSLQKGTSVSTLQPRVGSSTNICLPKHQEPNTSHHANAHSEGVANTTHSWRHLVANWNHWAECGTAFLPLLILRAFLLSSSRLFFSLSWAEVTAGLQRQEMTNACTYGLLFRSLDRYRSHCHFSHRGLSRFLWEQPETPLEGKANTQNHQTAVHCRKLHLDQGNFT